MNAVLRGFFATLVGSVALFSAHSAFATDGCFNDTDCPGNGMTCGGDVCNWNMMVTMPTDPAKPYTCVPAGSGSKGMEGWCTTDANCKCAAQGAKCTAPHCTFTKASDAPAGSGGASAGGSTSTAGTTSTAGASTTGGTSTAGTASMPASSSSSGGCSVGVPGGAGSALVAACLVGLGVAFSRRRRAA